MGEVVRAEETSYTIMDSISKFFVTRAKIVTKVRDHSFRVLCPTRSRSSLFSLLKIIKYPNVADYTRGLAENDEKQINATRFWILDLRNTYALLYDVLSKNMDKILKPRSHNTATMY